MQNLGISELRNKTLDEDTPNTYDTVKAALCAYFKEKMNSTAERYRYFYMKPESSTETHDYWITRLKTAGVDREFDKMDLKEAIKLAVTMHTNSSKLQAEVIAQDISYEKMAEKAKAIQLTKKEVEYMKETEKAFKVKASTIDEAEERVNFNPKEIHEQDIRLFISVTDQATILK